MAQSVKVFISYAREDQKQAIHLCDNLKKLDIDPWIDVSSLIAGQDWRQQIEDQLDKCDFVILLLSHNSIEKTGYVQAEKRYILDRLDQMPPNKSFLIPARLEACEPQHRNLKKIHRVDLFPTWKNGLELIAKAMGFDEKIIAQADFTELKSQKLTPRDYFEVVLPTILRWKGPEAAKLNKNVRFVVGEEYNIRLKPPVAGVTRTDLSAADVQITLTEACMQSILDGTFDARKALHDGEVKLAGDLSIMKEVGYLFMAGKQ